jgi:N-acetylglucosaminyldiphosphoundecaprenol N-acetyl-beta-D-mannosaminyltransferase
MKNPIRKINIFNVALVNLTRKQLTEKIYDGGIVFTLNIDHLVRLQKDSEFYDAYQSADYCTCDSQLLFYFIRLLGKPLREKISGSDFFPFFYNYYRNDRTIKIFLLGALPGIALEAQRKINLKVGREMVVGTYSPYFGFENDEKECQVIIDLINQSQANVLVVGVGAPKQEKWIYKYGSRLRKVKIFLALGATIGFESGLLSRAPKWLCVSGLEWFYRLIHEPRRLWKRYLVDDTFFLWLVLQHCFNLYKNPWKPSVDRYARNTNCEEIASEKPLVVKSK